MGGLPFALYIFMLMLLLLCGLLVSSPLFALCGCSLPSARCVSDGCWSAILAAHFAVNGVVLCASRWVADYSWLVGCGVSCFLPRPWGGCVVCGVVGGVVKRSRFGCWSMVTPHPKPPKT